MMSRNLLIFSRTSAIVVVLALAFVVSGCGEREPPATPAQVVAPAGENPAYWKYQVKGEFDQVLSNLKTGLETAQFLITDEENLAKGLENNKHMLGGEEKWNTIGFDRATAVLFCSIVFNHEVFNIDMDWSILCPFKVVAYTMKSDPKNVTLITVRPTFLLKDDPRPQAKDVGQRIEKRIVDGIKKGVTMEITG